MVNSAGEEKAGMSLPAAMQACEEMLLHEDFRQRPELLEKLLTADFIEISSNGSISDRQSVVNWLLQKDPAARWEFASLTVLELTPEQRLVRYQARQVAPQVSTGKGALHSSLWCYSPVLQCWQLRFHQATRIV